MNKITSLNSNFADKFELHYVFHDNSHIMDAYVRHKCEGEFLSIVKEVAQILDLKIEINNEAYLEGGLKEIWTLLGANNKQIALIIAILTVVLTKVPSCSSELDKNQIENAKLERIEKLLNIKKLKSEIDNDSKSNISEVELNEIATFLEGGYKVIKHKSNFYSTLNNYPKIRQIEFSIVDKKRDIIDEPKIIERQEFQNYILETDEISPIIDEGATIEIISPVLKKGRYKWRGVYSKTRQIIDFSMKDTIFKDNVVKDGISFKNGSCIDCVLEITQKIDESGEVKTTGYNVITVTSVHDETSTIEVISNKKNQHKTIQKDQYKLFKDENE